MPLSIVSVSKIVPFASAPHAGGQFYYQHIRTLLSLGYRVTIISPYDERNVDARARLDLPVNVLLFGKDPTPAGSLGIILARMDLRDRVYKGRLNRRHRKAFRREPAVLSAVLAADLVEFQWTEAGELAAGPLSEVRRSWPEQTPRVLIAHDVLAQRENRRLDAAKKFSARWTLARVRRRQTVRDECRTVKVMDLVLALSPKDKGMLQTISTGTSVVSVTPPLTLERIETPGVHERSAGVLFVGAFHRPENIDAALWLLREIWPLVRARNPAAELVIAGASPTAQMRILANDLGSVTVTGYVPSLLPYYASCLVNVVPLRQGAGVKFKTIDALLMGQAVVSTSVGLEGIHGPEGTVWACAETADEIAGAILEALEDPRHSASVGKKAAEWAAAEYSHENYSSTLLREYARLITSRVRE